MSDIESCLSSQKTCQSERCIAFRIVRETCRLNNSKLPDCDNAHVLRIPTRSIHSISIRRKADPTHSFSLPGIAHPSLPTPDAFTNLSRTNIAYHDNPSAIFNSSQNESADEDAHPTSHNVGHCVECHCRDGVPIFGSEAPGNVHGMAEEGNHSIC